MAAVLAVWTLAALVGCAPRTAATVPEATPEPPLLSAPARRATPMVYHVQPGDTLSSLGRRFGVPWQEIAAENEIVDPTRLRTDQVLFIPRVEGAQSPPEAPAPPPPETIERKPVSREALHRGNPGARFWWPTQGQVVRRYGDLLRGLPDPGLAISAPAGTEVYAVDAGTVLVHIRGGSAWGNVVALAHSDGWVSWYAHLDRTLVQERARVGKGTPIGTVGATGAAAGPRLAFRLFRNERPVNPERYLP